MNYCCMQSDIWWVTSQTETWNMRLQNLRKHYTTLCYYRNLDWKLRFQCWIITVDVSIIKVIQWILIVIGLCSPFYIRTKVVFNYKLFFCCKTVKLLFRQYFPFSFCGKLLCTRLTQLTNLEVSYRIFIILL